MLRQYILTRFNLRLWTHDKNNQSTMVEDWMKQRIHLFETYCLPSISAQTLQEFCWIILFDSETSKEVQLRIATWRKCCPQIQPIWVQGKYSTLFAHIFSQVMQQDIEQLRQKGKVPTKVAATYLDNDDALTIDFLERVATECHTIDRRMFISFRYGLQFFEGMGLVNRISYPNNHFQTLVELVEFGGTFRTPYGFGSHTTTHKLNDQIVGMRLIQTPDQPAWIEVVHSQNVMNDVRMTLRTRPVTNSKILLERAHIKVNTTLHPYRIFFTVFLLRFFIEVFRHLRARYLKSCS